MVYRAIGLMSGSSLDGLDIVFAELNEHAGSWSFDIQASACYEYDAAWRKRLEFVIDLNARDYQLLHADYGHYLGAQVNQFINENDLHFKVGLISSHGHTSFHMPSKKMTAQLGDGAAIAAVTGLPVVSDLRALDIAFGGQGAPIVPIGEKFLFPEYRMFLNLGGIANISFNFPGNYIAFDVCPANRVLNMLSNLENKAFDEGGNRAASGTINTDLLEQLNRLDYYQKGYPKSLANNFGTETVFPVIEEKGLPINDALSTYVAHIIFQLKKVIDSMPRHEVENQKLLVTGGGAFNDFLIRQLKTEVSLFDIDVVVPEENIVNNKEALVMAFIGVLRWRQEYNVLASVTGAQRNSIGGAVWIGQEA
jgi:anhydro-N-acetylmuramic acid kinase